ncbi:hypothetical protein BD410DRAFT_763596 [Rickenella mellea]|uniref:Protein-S-isoprenylcysteine O-methyltransferase n=1 Tax=Rickenella mellea TaxID=50990 RepID=A0A4Y7QFE3_9AGAM|nr:hypothetical protein BD410DRAFT_763596 [Rickenella mellea]
MTVVFPATLVLALLFFRVAITPPVPPARDAEKTLDKNDVKRKADGLRNLVHVIKQGISVLVVLELLVAVAPWSLVSPVITRLCPSSYHHSPPSNQLFVALALMIAGGALRLLCYRALGSAFTWEVTKPSMLVTTGPYAWARHPSYPGIWLTMTGSIIFLLSPTTVLRECIPPGGARLTLNIFVVIYILWAATWCGFLAIRARGEDALLKKEFGKQWEAWNEKTRAMFIPFVW